MANRAVSVKLTLEIAGYMANARGVTTTTAAMEREIDDLGDSADSTGRDLKQMAAKTPMRRNGTAADVAAAVVMMATAPQFITGQILAVDGGLELV